MNQSIKEFLSKFDKIISLTHSDFDGIMSAMVIKKYALEYGKKISISFNSYNNIDKNIEALNLAPNEVLVLTDVFPKDVRVLSKFVKAKQILVIDHHATSGMYFNPSKMFFNIASYDTEGSSAALLAYELFEEPYMYCLKDICTITSVYDLWKLTDPLRAKSEDFNMLFQYYWEKMADAFIDGRTEFNNLEVAYIKKEKARFINIYDNLEYYDIDDFPFATFFMTSDFFNECADKTFKDKSDIKICFIYSPISNTLSVRSKLEDIDIGKVVTDLQYGGGHKNACGIRISKDEPDQLAKIVSMIKVVLKRVVKIQSGN